MELIEKLLINALRASDRSKLFVDLAKLFGESGRSRSFHLSGDLFQTIQHRVLQTMETVNEDVQLLRSLLRIANFGQGIILPYRQYLLRLGAQLLHRDGEILLLLGRLTRHFRSQKISEIGRAS